jgi:GH43 family beta-xylosidase
MLTHVGGDVMEPRSWKKSPTPVFSRYTGAEGAVYGPGHNGFFKSPDGREDWMIYHGKEASEYTYRGRSARAQRFRWRTDGTPDFGRPIPRDIPLRVPSGERGPRGRRHPKLLHIITPEMGLYVMRS